MPRRRPCAWLDRQEAGADRRLPDRRLHGRRGARRPLHRIAGAAGRCRPHADRCGRARPCLVCLPSRRTAGHRPSHLRLRPGQDTGRLHQRHRHLRHRAVDRLRGLGSPAGADAGARRADAGGGDPRPAGQYRLLLRAAWRRPRKPEHARRHPACARRPARLGGGDRGGAGHPGDRLDADRPDPVGPRRRC